MNKVFSAIFLLAFTAFSIAQGPPPKAKRSGPGQAAKQVKKAPVRKAVVHPEPKPTPSGPEAERASFDRALAAPTTVEKAQLLRGFIEQFPESELREEAFTYLVTARSVVGNELLRSGDISGAIASFKLAVEQAPSPVPDRLFEDIIIKIPGSLFYSGQRPASMELAQVIERKVASNARQSLAMGGFYLSIENAGEARRVAEAVIAADPNNAAAYQALGLAHRLNFELEEAAKAYAKAAEIDPTSVLSRRGLAEMNRALGKPDAAATVYRELLAANANDSVARQGLILSMFDAGHQKEAEEEFDKFLQAEPGNVALLTSVGYWYAANNKPDRAVELAKKAVDSEPRYIWGHIVLARGLMKQNKPVDAERTLLGARRYGNFPTLDYEIASARYQAGLYREAVEELQKSFSIKGGAISTKLGGRVPKEEKSFHDLVAHERKASMLQPLAADNPETSEKLRVLFELSTKLEQGSDEVELASLADQFASGTDRMKLHRQLYAASLLLQKNAAAAKAAELVKSAIGNVDEGLDVAAPGAATMASELYESRAVAFSRNEVLVIPEVPRQTLSAILRGRIEELAGWTLYQQKNYPEAVIRLRRAITVLPDKSAWWRSSMWRLGAALEADGKEKEALDSYIRSYVTDRPSPIRYGAIEALYRKVHGSLDGLEDKIGPNPMTATALPETRPAPEPAVTVDQSTKAGVSEPSAASANSAPIRLPRHVPAKATEASNAREPAIPTGADLTTAQNPQTVTAEVNPTKEPHPPSTVETTGAAKPADAPETTVSEQKAAGKTAENLAVDPPKTNASGAELPGPVRAASESKEEMPPTTEKAEPAPSPEPVREVPETAKTEPGNTKADTAGTPSAPVEAVIRKDALRPLTDVEPERPTQKPIQEAAKEPAESSPKTSSGDLPARLDAASDQPARQKADSEPQVEPPAVPPPDLTPAPVKDGKPERSETVEPLSTAKPPPADTSVTETAAAQQPEKSERKSLVIVNDPFKPGPAAPSKSTNLFEPVIITVPSSPQTKVDRPQAAKSGESGDASGSVRRRVIEGKEIVSDQRCSVEVSQDSIMLLSGGGSLGLRVRIEGEGDINDVTFASSSPRDIEVRPEPLIDKLAARRFYVIKSVSERTGVFQVNFESPCGKKEVAVHVR